MAKRKPSEVNGILVVDKASGCTSHDVVQLARRAYRTRAVGHAGTLDPMATGVLVLAIGQATKLVPYLTSEDKAYETEITFGVSTHSLDADGDVTHTAPVPDLDGAGFDAHLNKFRGKFPQMVPKVSAVRVGGERLHALTRRGIEVELPVRDVEVRDLSLLSWLPPKLRLALHVTKGFYVRALARDLAAALDSAAHLTALRRTQSGDFTLEGAVPQSVLAAAAAEEQTAPPVMSLAEGCRFATVGTLSDTGVRDAGFGRLIANEDVEICPSGDLSKPLFALCDDAGELIALAEKRDDRYKIVRGFPREARI
jgi:tRNA pseudouridine55 synthase